MGSIVSDADLAEFRAMVEAEFDDRCWIRREGPRGVDPETGYTVPTWTDVYGTEAEPAPCRFRMTSSLSLDASRDVTTGQQPVVLTQIQLQVPMSVVGVRAADEVVAGPCIDPELNGRVAPIDGPFGQTHGVARRFVLKELS